MRCEQVRGVWGHAPPGKFFKLGTLRSLLRPCLGQNATRITPPVVFVAGEAIEPAARNDRHVRRAHVSPSPICALASRTSIAIYIAKTEKPKFSRRYFGCLKA